MVHPSESKSRRWKSANTPDTSAPSAARTPSRDTRSESGNARVARRRLPEAHGLFRKSRAGYKERSTQKPDRSHQDSRCCRHEIDHPTTERNRGGVKYECMGMELFYSRRKAFMSGCNMGNNRFHSVGRPEQDNQLRLIECRHCLMTRNAGSIDCDRMIE